MQSPPSGVAIPSEQKELEQLLRSSVGNVGDRDALLAHPEAIELGVAQIAPGRVFVSEYRGEVVGFADVEPRVDGESELDGLFVEPRMHLAELGHQVQILRTPRCGRCQNPHAKNFYLASGFEVLGITVTRFGSVDAKGPLMAEIHGVFFLPSLGRTDYLQYLLGSIRHSRPGGFVRRSYRFLDLSTRNRS